MLAKVLRRGILKSRKSITPEGTIIETPTLTAKDLENLKVAGQYGVTGVMLPFVRSDRDLICLRQKLEENHSGHIKIFAKIENMQGVEALDTFLSLADEIVIARGDLGTNRSSVPAGRKTIYGRHSDVGFNGTFSRTNTGRGV